MGNARVDPDSPEFFPDELPLRVTIDDFDLARTEVTAAQYCEFLNSPEVAEAHDRALYYVLDDERPGYSRWSTIRWDGERYVPRPRAAESAANAVTWLGAMRYCEWLTRTTGVRYRLPTEAEWEYAARGKEAREWPWGNEAPYIERQRKPWHLFGSAPVPDGSRGNRWVHKPWTEEPWPDYAVNAYPAGATPEGVFGLLDDPGEWTLSAYHANPTAAQANDTSFDFEDLDLEVLRVKRGGYHKSAVKNRPAFFAGYLWIDGRVWTRIAAHATGQNRGNQPSVAGVRLLRELQPRKRV